MHAWEGSTSKHILTDEHQETHTMLLITTVADDEKLENVHS